MKVYIAVEAWDNVAEILSKVNDLIQTSGAPLHMSSEDTNRGYRKEEGYLRRLVKELDIIWEHFEDHYAWEIQQWDFD